MSKQTDIQACVEQALAARSFAVLATERDGQPHSSMVAITPLNGFRELIFATYRNTRKFRNLSANDKVAVFIDGRETQRSGTGLHDGVVLTGLGHAHAFSAAEKEAGYSVHLARHPDLESFLNSPDCALIRVSVDAWQVVGAIDDVKWWRLMDEAAT